MRVDRPEQRNPSMLDRVRKSADSAVDVAKRGMEAALQTMQKLAAQLQQLFFPKKDSFTTHAKDNQSVELIGASKQQSDARFTQNQNALPLQQSRQVFAPQQNGGVNVMMASAGVQAAAPLSATTRAASADAVVTVKSGDTLSQIAAKHGVSWQELARHNQLDNPNLIFPGQQIRIPGANQPAPSVPVPSQPAPSQPAPSVPAPAPAAPANPTEPAAPQSREAAIDRLIDYTATNEGGGRYDAWNPNDNGAGVSFGLIQFNQQKGSLPTLMQRMYQANPQKFDQIFGPHAANMRNPGWVRSANLNDGDIKSRMLAAAREPEFQKVQRDVAKEGYFDSAEGVAREFNIISERGRAMMFDTAVQYGVGGMTSKLRQAVQQAGPGASERQILAQLANLADTHGYDANRRHRILDDPGLSDAPLGQGGVGSTSATSGATPYSERGVHDGGSSYVVRPGDSLSRIANLLGTDWQTLYALNRDTISNPNTIHAGQVLKLPGGAPSSPGTPGTPGTSGPQGPSGVTPSTPGAGGSVMNIASGELGVREDAGRDEDRDGRIRGYRNAVTAPGYNQNRGPEPWCADFVSWVYKQSGRPLGPEGKGFAYVPYMKSWLQDSGQWHSKGSGYTPKAGDIVVFNWDGGRPDHVGLVDSVNADGSINTIEGNAPDGVHRRKRTLSTIEGFGHLG